MAPLAAEIVVVILAMITAQTGRRKKTTRRKRVYGRSERNVIIDAILHPLANVHWVFIIIDGALHAVNEGDPIQSFGKFLKYSAPELLKRILEGIG